MRILGRPTYFSIHSMYLHVVDITVKKSKNLPTGRKEKSISCDADAAVGAFTLKTWLFTYVCSIITKIYLCMNRKECVCVTVFVPYSFFEFFPSLLMTAVLS